MCVRSLESFDDGFIATSVSLLFGSLVPCTNYQASKCEIVATCFHIGFWMQSSWSWSPNSTTGYCGSVSVCPSGMAPIRIIIPSETKFRGVYWIHPVRPSVRPSVRPWVGVRMITLILFSGFKIFFLHISLGSRSCMGLNISVLPH